MIREERCFTDYAKLVARTNLGEENVRKLFGLILALIIMMAIFFSALFISMEMGHHDCSGEDCPICATMEECVNNIRICGMAAVVAFVISSFVALARKQMSSYMVDTLFESLIVKRVRLNY